MAIAYKLLLLFLSTAFFPAVINAQITVRSTLNVETRPNALVPLDSIYLVQEPILEGGGNVVLESVTNTTDYYYEWTRYDVSTNTWTIPVANGFIASYPVPMAGGYQVIIKDGMNGAVVEQHRCWIFNSPLSEASIEVVSENCDYLHLKAESDSLVYYGTFGNYALVDYIETYIWSSSPGAGDFSSSEQAPTINAPVENTEFTVTVIDLFDNSESASLSYTAIAVQAHYTSTPMKEPGDVRNEGHTSLAEGSAPLEIRFTDESKGQITTWFWDFGSGAPSTERDPFHVFTSVGEHIVFLTVNNIQSGCESTVSLLTVNITEMDIDAPNVFTPNGDGNNDEFRVYYKSVKKFSMVVFNRWGRKVYESTNPAEGWDGTIGNGLADPGVYFYVIEAEGYNPNEKKKLQGPIHLIRGKD